MGHLLLGGSYKYFLSLAEVPDLPFGWEISRFQALFRVTSRSPVLNLIYQVLGPNFKDRVCRFGRTTGCSI